MENEGTRATKSCAVLRGKFFCQGDKCKSSALAQLAVSLFQSCFHRTPAAEYQRATDFKSFSEIMVREEETVARKHQIRPKYI